MRVFAEKLRMWRNASGFTQPEMASLLGLGSQPKYYNYERVDDEETGARSAVPSGERVVGFARRMLVRLDWLFGESERMWNDELLDPLRTAIRQHTAAVIVESDETALQQYMKREAADQHVPQDSKRACALLRFTHKFDPERYDLPILQALATKYFKGKDYVKDILEGENVRIPDEGIRRLSEVWGVSLMWLRTGTHLSYHNEIDAEKWSPTIDQFDMDGLTPEFFRDIRAELIELRNAWLQRQKRTPS